MLPCAEMFVFALASGTAPMRRLGCAAAVSVTILGANTVLASPLADATAGRAVFTGVATAHPTSLASNPAALLLGGTGPHAYVAGTGRLDRMRIDRQQIDPVTGELQAPVSTQGVLTSTGATLAIYQTGESYVAGAMLLSPAPEERTLAGDDLRYHTTGDSLRGTNLGSLGVAFRLGKRLAFGGSLTLFRTDLTLGFALDTALESGRDSVRGIASACGSTPCGLEHPDAASRLRFVGDTDSVLSSVVYSVALMGELVPGWWLALSYRIAPDLARLRGTTTFAAAPRDGGMEASGDALAYVPLPAAVDTELRGPLGDHWELHIGGRWEDSSAVAAIDLRVLSSELRNAGAPEWVRRARGMRDAVAGWVGVEQTDLGERARWGARLGVRSPEVGRSGTSPTAIAGWNVSVDTGVHVRLTDGLVAQLSVGAEYYPRVSVSQSEYDPLDRLDCVDSGYAFETAACENTRNGFAVSSGAGTYKRMGGVGRLGLRYDFE